MAGRTQTGAESRCIFCAEQERVLDVDVFERGQHIALPGAYGRRYNSAKRKLTPLYQHHAIVVEVKERPSKFQVKMVLIHFCKKENAIQIEKTTENYHLIKDEIYLVHHADRPFTPNEVVERAERKLHQYKIEKHVFMKYNAVTNNCEHFANWCVLGEQSSFQVSALRRKIRRVAGYLIVHIAAVAVGVFREMQQRFDETNGQTMKNPNLDHEILLGVVFFIYLSFCLGVIVLHFSYYRRNIQCLTCLRNESIDQCVKFTMFVVSNLLSFLISYLNILPNAGFWLVPILLYTSLRVHLNAPKIRNAIQSPLSGKVLKVVTNVSEIKVGDILLLPYYGFAQKIIVVEILNVQSQTIFTVRAVHYGCNGWFEKRRVIKDLFDVNLQQQKVQSYNMSNLPCFEQKEVVNRAESRINETKWAMFTSRSSHFCFWAKVKQQTREVVEDWTSDDTSSDILLSNIFSSLHLGEMDIHLSSEIRKGDAVFYKHWGILCNIQNVTPNGRCFEILLIYYDWLWKVRQGGWIKIDLNKDKLSVRKYHPAHCYNSKDRCRRAKYLLSRPCKSWTTRGFLEECITKYSPQVNDSLEDSPPL